MEAYIVKAYRSAVGKAKKGGFRQYRSDDLAVDVIKYLMQQTPELDPLLVDDVIVGCANPEGEQGLQIGRMISLRALGKEAPGMTINRYCASGLEAISIAVAKVRAGMGQVYIAGGTENMSMIPMTGYKLAPNYNVANSTPNYIASMGITAEAVAQKYGISREDSDRFSLRSHQLAGKAIDAGLFRDEIVPITVPEVFVEKGKKVERSYVVDTDEGVRRETTLEGLSQLRPAFASNGIVTAGSSSQTSDGAAFTLVMSEEMVVQLNLQPIARLVSCSVAGVDPLYMGIGPCAAIPKALKQAGLKALRHPTHRTERGFCDPSSGRHQGGGPRPRNRQCKRRRHRTGAPTGMYRRQTQHPVAQRNEAQRSKIRNGHRLRRRRPGDCRDF